jgi:hypothetical protein
MFGRHSYSAVLAGSIFEAATGAGHLSPSLRDERYFCFFSVCRTRCRSTGRDFILHVFSPLWPTKCSREFLRVSSAFKFFSLFVFSDLFVDLNLPYVFQTCIYISFLYIRIHMYVSCTSNGIHSLPLTFDG